MKAQNKYPYDSAILGLNNVYLTIGSDSFYINSECILATDKTITIGREYILFDTSKETGIKMSNISLVDCFFSEGNINLIVQDIRSQQVFTISQFLECTGGDCTDWILVSMDYFYDLMDAKAIQNYCGCDYDKKPTNGDSNPEVNKDLLEFEF